MRYHILLPLFMLIAGCVSTPAPAPVPTPHTFGADADQCPAAAANLAKLSCPDGRGGHVGDPNKHGDTFVDLCQRLYIEGVNFQAPCLAQALSCTEVDACRP